MNIARLWSENFTCGHLTGSSAERCRCGVRLQRHHWRQHLPRDVTDVDVTLLSTSAADRRQTTSRLGLYCSMCVCVCVCVCHSSLCSVVVRPHRRTTYVAAAYCYRPSSVVRRSLCRSVTVVSPAKSVEPIEMPFGLRTRVGPMNRVLNGVRMPP